MEYLLITFVLLLILFIAMFLLTDCRHKHPTLKKLTSYRYAHRGLHDKPKIPENSMAAFSRALEQGLGIELDVHLTRDGRLAVIHDYSLLRTAGVDLKVEEMTSEELKKYPLEDSDERIPMLEEVLSLYDGKAPIIIEIKALFSNHAEISRTLAKVMENYSGDYCVESFFPQTLLWFRKHRPQVCRGQLSMNFFKKGAGEGLSLIEKIALSNLFVNIAGKPDFVAYNYQSRKYFSFLFTRFFHRPSIFYWTITSEGDMNGAECDGGSPIFEQFVPKSPKVLDLSKKDI